MTLTTNGLDYIAENFGIGDCFASSGLNWNSVDHDGVSIPESGGTKYIVGRLINDTVYARIELTSPRTGTYTKSLLIEANDDQSITLPDVNNADANYCVATTTACDPGDRRCNGNNVEECLSDGSGWYTLQTCGEGWSCVDGACVLGEVEDDLPTTGPIEITIGAGTGCDPGSPDVLLDTDGAYAYYKTEPYTYIGVGGIYVHNRHATCYAYFSWEAKIWDGHGYTACPTTAPERQEINRYLAEPGERPLSFSKLEPSETDIIWGSFEVPASMEGEKTLCLSLWGNFDYQALLDEINAEGYYDKI